MGGGICMQFSVGTLATDLFAKVKTKTERCNFATTATANQRLSPDYQLRQETSTRSELIGILCFHKPVLHSLYNHFFLSVGCLVFAA